MGGKVYTIVKYYLGKGERLCNIDPDKYSYMDFIEDIKDLHGVSNNNIKIRCGIEDSDEHMIIESDMDVLC
ncbi:UNVERIFIED_CONTAM: hypothetical protein Sindi_0155100, partial [Sesamum indicum]